MKSINNQLGLAAVELTILTPFIMLLLYIAVDFGRVMSEVIVTNSSANAAAGYGSIHSTDIDEAIDSAGMLAIASKDAQGLSMNTGESSRVDVTSVRVCRCYDSDAVSLPEPTESVCSESCPENKEVYIQTTVSRNFKTFSGHEAMPGTLTLNRSARYRVE